MKEDTGLSLVESDAGGVSTVHLVVRDSRPERPAPLPQHRRHGLHQLRRVFLITALHHADVGPASSLPVPDVLGQQHRLQTREGADLGEGEMGARKLK